MQMVIVMLTFVFMARSHKEKRSSYAPQEGVRYDGIYRIEKCWRKIGTDVGILRENNSTYLC